MQINVALFDADHRVLLVKPVADTRWTFPHAAAVDNPADAAVAMLAADWQVQTFAKALFALTFAADGDVTLLYGCRNWVGAGGLQRVQALDDIETLWVPVARLGDQMLAPAALAMWPALATLTG